MKGARRTSICSSMSVARKGIGDGRRDARRTLDATPVAYLDRRRLRERIHGRPRSDRKKRFLLSAVAPSTITRHPRERRSHRRERRLWHRRRKRCRGSAKCARHAATDRCGKMARISQRTGHEGRKSLSKRAARKTPAPADHGLVWQTDYLYRVGCQPEGSRPKARRRAHRHRQ
jgi:hypothetical protein